ncbi:hypothetical protein B0H34DRAFT_46392 [Crassisporium funariophilum]|nr:hypothetical protein B0H34DRAFT_46392 [Crassisporium funariophilum]
MAVESPQRVDPLIISGRIRGSPPPLPYRNHSVDAYVQSQTSLSLSDKDEAPEEHELNEQQLRELYDNEEIERFLHLFSSYVTEVRVPETPAAERSELIGNESVPDLSGRTSEDGEWTPVDSSGETVHPHSNIPTTSTEHASKSLSEEIAYRYILPFLPYARPPATPFTLGRLRLATQRLYLAVLPAYGPFFSHLMALATWEDHGTSMIYCSIYWTLWWYNFLAPAVVLRILFSLVKRRIFPYPSLQDLRQHREDLHQADEFGAQVSARLSASATGMKEVWRLFRLFDQTKKHKAKAAVKQKAKDKGVIHPTEEVDAEIATKSQDATVLDDADDNEDSKDIKRLVLHVLNEIADLHERVRNVFIWRRPASSRIYGVAIFFVFLVTLLPTKYISKLTFFILGFLFWHAVPIIAALPPSERARLPPPLDDVPTDAEYAMQLISQRVAAGLEVKPAKAMKHGKKQQTADSIDTASLAEGSRNKHKGSLSQGNEGSIDWKKWGDRVAMGKSAVNDIKRLKPGKPWPVHDVWPPRHPIIPDAVGIAQPQSNIETHTYPCQHSSAPGLITLMHSTMYFTPLMWQNAKISIPLSDVKGVKKAGMLKGLHIRWNDTSEGNKDSKEEKFLWVGERDELFARLVGSDGRRWMQV